MLSPDWADAVALLRQETAHPLQVIDEEPRRQCSADGEYNQIGCIADHASPLLKAFARFSRSFASASICDAIRRSSSLPCGVVRAISLPREPLGSPYTRVAAGSTGATSERK